MQIPEHLKKRYGEVRSMLYIYGASPRLKHELLQAFTVSNPAYEQAARFSPWGAPKLIPEFIMLAREEGNAVVVPRGILPHAQLSAKGLAEFKSIRWTQKTNNAPTDFPELRVTLNPEQETLLKGYRKAIKENLNPFGTYLFIAPTSVGKTIGQSAIAAIAGQRVLVLCLTNRIMLTWRDDLEKAFGIPKKEQGIIQQAKWNIGKHFTLASVQTLARRKDRWKELHDQIGCVIVDEADTISAPSIYNFIFEFPARTIIGATATHLSSRHNIYLQAAFGNPVTRIITSYRDTASSMAVQDAFTHNTQFNYKYSPLDLDYHDLTQTMALDEGRNKIIVNQVRLDIKNGLTPLVVTRRVPHVQLLKDMLKEAGVDCLTITGEDNANRAQVDRDMKQIMAREIKCVVATDRAILRGANINPLDVLHVTMPESKRDLEQLAGRIRRRYDKKTKCLIRYYVDRNVPYLYNKYKREAVAAFRTLKIKRYQDLYMA